MVEPSQITPTVQSTEESESERRVYNFRQIFKKIEGLNRIVEQRAREYTIEDLENYMSNPVRNMSMLIEINNYMYNTNSFFKEYIDYLVRPVLYRWTVETEAKNEKFYKEKPEKMQKSFLAFVDRINSLGLEKELKRILLRMCLEDAVYGYWLEDNNGSTIYYLPSTWCVIRSTMNGMWSFSINSKAPSNRDLEYLPKEIVSLINKHRSKSGDEAYAPVPYEKSVCFKMNDHFQYVFPPFCGVIAAILRLLKMMDIADARDELDIMNLIAMEIPIGAEMNDDLKLTEDVIDQFVQGARSIVSDLIGIIPTPMKMTPITLSNGQNQNKNMVENAINAYGEETNMPSFGGVNSGAELKRAIENTASKIFSVLDQISAGVNLKLKLEGFTYPSYGFNFEILHMNQFNKIETQETLLKQAQAGLFVKMRLLASVGVNPSNYIGQSYVENTLFRDVIDTALVFQTAYTREGGSDGDESSTGKKVGRPTLPDAVISPSTEQTRAVDANNPDNKNI